MGGQIPYNPLILMIDGAHKSFIQKLRIYHFLNVCIKPLIFCRFFPRMPSVRDNDLSLFSLQ